MDRKRDTAHGGIAGNSVYIGPTKHNRCKRKPRADTSLRGGPSPTQISPACNHRHGWGGLIGQRQYGRMEKRKSIHLYLYGNEATNGARDNGPKREQLGTTPEGNRNPTPTGHEILEGGEWPGISEHGPPNSGSPKRGRRR